MDFQTQLREEFTSLKKESNDLITTAITDKRELTADEKTANETRFSRMNVIKASLADYEKFAALALSEGKIELPKAPAGKAEFDAARGKENAVLEPEFNKELFSKAITHYARTGEMPKELFTTTSGSNSGAFLPKQVLPPVNIRRLNNAFRNVLAAYGVSPIEVDHPHAFSLPVEDDTANNGQAQSESATAGTALDPVQTSLQFSPTLYSSKQRWFSNTMVMGQSFDVLGYVTPQLQKRIDKIQESAFAAEILATGVVGFEVAASDEITYDELLSWEHSLAPEYRTDAAFVVSDSLLRLLRAIKDDSGRPIFDVDPTGTFQGRIHGKPVIVCESFQAVGPNAISGAFVSAEALKIVDVLSTRMCVYTKDKDMPDQTGYEIFTNGDFGFISKGVRLLQHADGTA